MPEAINSGPLKWSAGEALSSSQKISKAISGLLNPQIVFNYKLCTESHPNKGSEPLTVSYALKWLQAPPKSEMKSFEIREESDNLRIQAPNTQHQTPTRNPLQRASSTTGVARCPTSRPNHSPRALRTPRRARPPRNGYHARVQEGVDFSKPYQGTVVDLVKPLP